MLNQIKSSRWFWKYRHLIHPKWYQDYFDDYKAPRRKALVDLLHKAHGRPLLNVAEFGCASGPNLLAVKRAFPDCYVYGVDVSKPALKYAEWAFSVLYGHGFRFSKHLSFPPSRRGVIDGVIFDRVLYCMEPWDVMGVFKRYISAGAEVFIIDDFFAAPPVRGKYRAQDYAGVLWGLGFKVLSLEHSQHSATTGFHQKHAKIGVFQRA